MRLATTVYYALRPLLPRRVQIELRRGRAAVVRRAHATTWPIRGERPNEPPGWPGWPDGKRFALVLTHDVETEAGVERSARVAAMEIERGMRSAFSFVPKRYRTPRQLRHELGRRGFEVMVHGWRHDGMLFSSRDTFDARAERINAILQAWAVRGFAAPATHHDFRWMGALDVDHDVSSYDNDPFEPQRCGLDRVFPFWVSAPEHAAGGFVELPYTLAQDFTLFVMLGESGIDVWTRKLDWIARSGGMALLKTHPDYMAFSNRDDSLERYPAERYAAFLDHVRGRYGDSVWVALPREVAGYWRTVSRRMRSAPAAVPLAPTACPSCRAAHAAGRLVEYVPLVTPGVASPSVAAGAPEAVPDAPADRAAPAPLGSRQPL